MADASVSFGSVLKAWFRTNNWPQSVPEKLAKARGNKTGPWASQISHAMHDKHEPKVPFFLALAWFNEQVATRNVAGLTDRRLVDQIRNAEPICHDNGVPYGPADFFQLYAGLIDPPAELLTTEPQLTEEDVEIWTSEVRQAFRQVCLKHMVDRSEAWEMLKVKMLDFGDAAATGRENHDCLDWVQEVLCGLREPTVDEAIREAKRWEGKQPFARAMQELLGEKKIEMDRIRKKAAQSKSQPLPLHPELKIEPEPAEQISVP